MFVSVTFRHRALSLRDPAGTASPHLYRAAEFWEFRINACACGISERWQEWGDKGRVSMRQIFLIAATLLAVLCLNRAGWSNSDAETFHRRRPRVRSICTSDVALPKLRRSSSISGPVSRLLPSGAIDGRSTVGRRSGDGRATVPHRNRLRSRTGGWRFEAVHRTV
jgi:hypothetical protein